MQTSTRSLQSLRPIISTCRTLLIFNRHQVHNLSAIATASRSVSTLLQQSNHKDVIAFNKAPTSNLRMRRLFASQQDATSTTNDSVTPTSALQKASGRELVLSPPALVITRDYEWANIIIGFEQANKYTIRSAPGGEVVGYLAEESSIGGTITRNIMRTRRPFKATIFDKDGNIIFTLRRPLYLISTSIFVESPEGETLGEVHMNWHMWRRKYDLYVDKSQFASVDSGLLAVDFDMRDTHGRKIASVNKDFTGFAREIFTDARQYVLRMDPKFGLVSDGVLVNDSNTVDLPTEENGYSDFEMGPRERAVVLATAVAIDFDYFSVHSRGHHLNPALMMMPGGGGAGAGGGAAGAGAAVGADVLSESMITDEELSEQAVNTTDSSTAGESNQFNPDPVDDPYGTPMDTGENINESDWGTFEEPDHGFAEEPSDFENTEDEGGFGGGDDGGDDGEGGGGLFGVITSIFTDSD